VSRALTGCDPRAAGGSRRPSARSTTRVAAASVPSGTGLARWFSSFAALCIGRAAPRRRSLAALSIASGIGRPGRWVPGCALALCIGCGARPHAAPAAATDEAITLYRDRALVKQRVEVAVPPAGTAAIAIKVAAGVGPDDLVILDRGELTVSALRVARAVSDAPPLAVRDAAVPADPAEVAPALAEPAPAEEPSGAPPPPAPPRPAPAAPTEVEIVVAAPREGRFALALGYVTDRLPWEAAYTMTTTAARDRAIVRGAVAIRNATGVAFRAHTFVADAELGAWRDRAAEQLAGSLVGATADATTAALRDLGIIALGDGETRVELLAGDPPREMRSVLVYDPVGTRLDHPGAAPIADPALGADAAGATRVTESFEIERAGHTTAGLPAGPVRLLERRPDGSLAVLGESHLFDAASRVADVDTVAVGTADGVTGRRERRDWSKDGDQKRFSEEFLLTVDNARPRPIDVVIREHLYRGQNWTLAYQSALAAKEGPQQISLRTHVPANGRAKVLYVVVYTW